MTVRTRADLDSLPGYIPGKSVAGAVKLASNEVSLGPLPSVVTAIAAAAAGINRYPDSGATELVAALAAKLGVEPSQVAVGCGSVTLCQQLIQATCTEADEVLFPWRSFEAYPILTHVVGASQVRVPLTAEHALDIDAMIAAVTPATRLVYVCTPNNPTGTALTRAELERFIDAVPSDVLVVIDEAYREFVDDPEVPDGVVIAKEQWARGRDNVAVLRTFSKAYGLAGLRVGYLVAPESVTEAVRKVFVPFGVNAIAQVAALASLAAEDELLARCRDIVAERGRVRAELLALGYEVPETQANFVWLPLGERTAEFNEHCLNHKVVVRAFAGDGARVTIGTPEENDLFLSAAKAFSG
ncbi:histidinol-phosphate transaminase [Actinokineospora globicatena]|uniref:Aromatic amino acid aminotransferase n=1 Tax=Actinokineospora globicatena TaxID=103729 RepID=A0A9W6QNW6_9PSEU|nr:histidinol-phosphate transaminase [Actinokineospora globicatena]MCP2301072.1 histidinol-phosphate aminotransferase [Actinokineospora globicatena]GLW77293.1 putative phenylalanine aminotransferase [Actinokineospora globicatena]GLW84127.1 putative phenylalanine aminotransferase [Actinokineospora globicatena]GLW91929.1 putative phenylalanine aminotransferase [Actinokineospora globicatena]